MRLFPLFSVLFCSVFFTNAQAQYFIASDTLRLQRQLTDASSNKDRLNALHNLVDVYWEIDRDQSKNYLEQIEAIGANENLPAELAFVASRTATLSYFAGELDIASEFYQKSYEYYLQADSIEVALITFTRIGLMSCIQGEYSAAEKVYREVNKQLPAEGFLNAKGDLYNQFATLYHYQGIFDSANYYYDLSISHYESLGDTLKLLRPLGNQAKLFLSTSEHKKAFEKLQVIADYQRKKESWTSLASTLTSLAKLERNSNNNPLKGYSYAQEGYELSKRLNDMNMKAHFLYALAEASFENKDIEQTLAFIAEGKELAQKKQLQDILISFLIQEGTTKIALEDYTGGLALYEEALSHVNKEHGNNFSPVIWAHIGNVQYELGQIEAAKVASLRAFGKGKTDDDIETKLVAAYNLGRIYQSENQLAKAEEFATIAMELVTVFGKSRDKIATNELLAEIYKEKGNYQAALSLIEEARVISDSLVNVDQIRELTKEQKDFEFMREKEILAIQQQQEQAQLRAESQRNLIIAAGIGLLALVLGGFFYQSKRKNKLIREQSEQLSQLNATKDRIFAIIGHDLRKPAIAFRGITRKINYLLDKQDYERLAQLGQSIEADATALGQLTDNLLNWALLQKNIIRYQPEAIPLDLIAEEVANTFQRSLADKKLDLTIEIPEGAQVYADRSSLRTIVRNLIDNAIKYTPTGGCIRLTAAAENKQMKICVADTGIGIPQEKIPTIFLLQKEKSQQGTTGEKGTGLGLHLAQELTQLNKGILEVKSKLNEGSTFALSLPKVV